MNKRFLVAWPILALVLLATTSCQLPVKREAPDTEEKPAAELVQPDQGLSPSARVQRAIQALQVGDNQTARDQLNSALSDKPSLGIARRLLEQLDADPQALLGSQHFPYRIEPGDSLSQLSQRFLGDSLNFVILARYNQIDDPSQLKVGQIINIPGSPPEPQAPESGPDAADPQLSNDSAESEPAPVNATLEATSVTPPQSDDPGAPGNETAGVKEGGDVYLSAQKLYGAGRYQEAIQLLEPAVDKPGEDSTLRGLLLRDLLVRVYESEADRLAGRGNYDAARSLLEKAVSLDPANDKTINRLITIEDKLEAQRL